jgi:hypothetical protein
MHSSRTHALVTHVPDEDSLDMHCLDIHSLEMHELDALRRQRPLLGSPCPKAVLFEYVQ